MAVTKSWACDPLFLYLYLSVLLPMIARVWHGWTKPENAKAYEDMLRDEIFPSIAAGNIKGYRGAELFINEDGNEVEFVTLLRFDSMNAVKEFAGVDEGKPVIYPKAEALLTRMDERSRHYRVANGV